jgi:hypothetical protein
VTPLLAGVLAAAIACAAAILGPTALAAEPGSGDAAQGRNPRILAEASLGLKAGLSLAQHSGIEERAAEYQVTSSWRGGFALGAFVCFPVTSRFGLQQEVAYVQKGSRQKIGVEILGIPTVLDVTYDMDYIEIPVLLRFAWLQGNRSELYSLVGTALSLKVRDHYALDGEVSDGDQTIPLRARADMSEVEMFDYSFVYGTGAEFDLGARGVLVEYRFTIGWNSLAMPTYAYVPFEDDQLLIENDPVPLKNQNHQVMVGIRF